MTFMRKLLDALNMDNWGKNRIESISDEFAEKEKDDVLKEPINNSETEEKVTITEEDILAGLKKQYFIIDETEGEKESIDATKENIIPKSKPETEQYSDADEPLIFEASEKLKMANELANIANQTIDRDEFIHSINDIKAILRELLKYEGKLPFIGSPSADLRNLEQTEQSQIELLEKRIENSKINKSENLEFEPKKEIHSEKTQSTPEPAQRGTTSRQKIKKEFFQRPIDITQYAVMCNAYLDHQEEMEQYGIKSKEYISEEIETKQETTIETKHYEYILFTNNIDIPSIIGSRGDYMRKDYTIDPRYNESWSYIHKLWKDSADMLKVIKPKKFFEILEHFEESLKVIDQYSFLKFNPEKEKEYYYSQKDGVLIDFLNRSFTDEYRNALELKTAKGKMTRIGNWFSIMEYYKVYLTPNALEEFKNLGDKWQFEILPLLLEPENMKEI